jgi:hypothetical protein
MWAHNFKFVSPYVPREAYNMDWSNSNNLEDAESVVETHVMTLEKFLLHDLPKCHFNRTAYWLETPKGVPDSSGSEPNKKEFIEFLLRVGSSTNSFLVNEKPKEPNRLHVADGNNRLQAIKKFMRMPVTMFEDLVDSVLYNGISERRDLKLVDSDAFKSWLRARTLEQVYDLSTDDFRNSNTGFENPDIIQEVRERLMSNLVDFKKCFKVKGKTPFFNIDVIIGKCRNFDDEKMASMFIQTNRKARAMTPRQMYRASW